MAVSVELINNPYIQRLQVLIDGKAVSAYSGIEKFMDEPFTYWCDKILPAVYDELNGSDFTLHFHSSNEEINVMKKIATDYNHCIQFSSEGFVRKTPLIERMSKLNKLIQNNGINGYQRTICNAVFVVSDGCKHLIPDLESIEIKNLYCEVKVKALSYSEFVANRCKGDVTFGICKNGEQEKLVGVFGTAKGFLLSIGENNDFEMKRNEVLCFSTTQNDIFNTAFNCFLLGPLIEVFSKTVSTLSADVMQRFEDEIQTLLSTSVRVIANSEALEIELGHSVMLSLEADIEGYSFRPNDFKYAYSNNGIIKCNGMRVEGVKEGKSTLYVYREGENKPCAQLEYTVYKTNHITELTLIETGMYMGLGDTYSMEYSFYPPDADNVNAVEWFSDNEAVAQVDPKGNVKAIGEGDCNIWVTAGKISDRCDITVLPHISEIVTEQDSLELVVGQVIEIVASAVPENAIDSKLKYACIDVRVANVVSNKLTALKEGSTTLVIQNAEETVRKEISVVVYRKLPSNKKEKKKKGFFSKLFG